jgi:hypothetical protein
MVVSAAFLTGAALAANHGDDPVPGGWLSRVQHDIAASEYHVTWQEATYLADVDSAWHAPNRAQGFRTYFTETGIRVVPRTRSEPGWEWGLGLLGVGRGERLWDVDAPRQNPVEGRIEYDRGDVVEWYVNGPDGLEQGFTLWRRPEDGHTEATLTTPPRGPREAPVETARREQLAFVELALTGTLDPVFSTDGRAIDFRTGRGVNVVHFAKLEVTDASGHELPSWMEGFAGSGYRGIRIVYDDTDAAYPVTIDPLATTPAWTAEGDQDGANFGFQVATAGDVNRDGYSDVIVTAYYWDNGETNEGGAWVYHGSASGLSSTAAWTAEGDQADAHFGCAASTAGDVNGDLFSDVIVGACHYDNGETDEGMAFVYHGSGAGLNLVEAWSAEGDQVGASFGGKVAPAGDVNGDGYGDILVGAVLYDNGQNDEGGAWVYLGSASGLSSSPSWSDEGDQAGAYYAFWVGMAGDVNGDGFGDIVVGVRDWDNTYVDAGAVHLYYGSVSGPSVAPDWTVEGDQTEGRLGCRVGTPGDVNGDGYADLFATTSWYDFAQVNQGAAYVFHGSATGPSASADWTVQGEAPSAYGNSAGTAGDVNGDGYGDLVIGAEAFDDDQTNEGRVYVHFGSAAGLSTTPDWTMDGDQDGAYYGSSAATAGDVNGDGYADLIVGSRYYDNGEYNEGRAFVYHGSAAGLAATAGWTAESNQAGAFFAVSVSTAGDVNGDGYADVIVGANQYDSGEGGEGRAFVYHGSPTGLATPASWSMEGTQPHANFGSSVSTAGDVNGDGYADVIVGAEYYDNGENNEGAAFVYHGSATGLSAIEAWSAECDRAEARFGTSVSTAGDVNGDGYADVIVGAHEFANGELYEGAAFVYHGTASGLAAAHSWFAEGDQIDCRFGQSVATAGDVNGDGYSDVIVGAFYYDNPELDEGRALVYHGSVGGLSITPAWSGEGDQNGAYFGETVSTAGDVNGDGYSDVIVGANLYDNVEADEGRAFVYLGSWNGLSASADWTAEIDQVDARFGSSVSTAGDVNGDGYADVIIGAYLYDNGESDEGGAFLFLGSSAGLATTAARTVESDQADAGFGYAASAAGDVNGDGYADVIVGAYRYDGDQQDEGRAYLYYGNDGPGLSLVPQQRRADDLSPIAPGGRSRETGSFRLAATGRTPFGPGRVRLRWEVRPFGQPFTGGTTGLSPWIDSGATGEAINELISGLEPGAYHWRMRLQYDPATTPYAKMSRWFTVPENGWEEADLTVSSFVGGKVWEDLNGDGLMDAEEPMLNGILVYLLDDTDTAIASVLTGGGGVYRFEIPVDQAVKIHFTRPFDWTFTVRDQGVDDTIDSDADTITGKTALIGVPFDSGDETRWSAGMRQHGACYAPDEPIYIYAMRLSSDGNDYPILDFMDPNQPSDVTGYNIYRSSDPGLDPALWSLLADNVVDMDEGTDNKQWVDTSGDVSPTGTWYYEVTPYNAVCDEEGPR